MLTADIRNRWLDFFGDRGHTVVPSASLVSDDPSLLFTVAGMVPFIPYLTGVVPAPYPRATSVQKCIRTLDIEEVGKTPQGRQFFEDVDAKAREFGSSVVDGYKQREAELRAAVAEAEDVIADLSSRTK